MLLGVVESLTATFYGPSWAPAVAFGFLLLTLAFRPAGLLGTVTFVNTATFSLIMAAIGVAIVLVAHAVGVDYLYFASYTILQFIVLATAWTSSAVTAVM